MWGDQKVMELAITSFWKYLDKHQVAPVNWNLYAVNISSLEENPLLCTKLWPLGQHNYPLVAACDMTFMTLFFAIWKRIISSKN